MPTADSEQLVDKTLLKTEAFGGAEAGVVSYDAVLGLPVQEGVVQRDNLCFGSHGAKVHQTCHIVLQSHIRAKLMGCSAKR